MSNTTNEKDQNKNGRLDETESNTSKGNPSMSKLQLLKHTKNFKTEK